MFRHNSVNFCGVFFVCVAISLFHLFLFFIPFLYIEIKFFSAMGTSSHPTIVETSVLLNQDMIFILL